MDPYMEPHWLDVHTRITAYAADALNRSLPPDLIASTEERVAIETDAGEERILGPDVRVFEPPADQTAVIEEEVHGGPIKAPLRLLAQVEPITERFIKIIEAGTERLITVIEFVSPTNKRGAGLLAFKQKRAEMLASAVNFVEVDLTRSGDWRALLRPHRSAKRATSTYRVAIRSPRDPAAVYLHPVRLQDRLPLISIPLRPKDPDVQLDLQPLLDQTYANGRYERRLDYRKPLDPPLDPDDAAWAQALLKPPANR
jgi:hypothetical protein